MRRGLRIVSVVAAFALVAGAVILSLVATQQRRQIRSLRLTLSAQSRSLSAAASSEGDVERRVSTLEQDLGTVSSSSDSNSATAETLARRVQALELEVNGITGVTVAGADIRSQLQQIQAEIGAMQSTIDCLTSVANGSAVFRC